MLQPTFELITAVPWMENALQDTLAPITGGKQILPGAFVLHLTRRVPRTRFGADGTLWLGWKPIVSIGRDQESPKLFPLNAAKMESLATLASLQDGGIIALGQEEEHTVMARLSSTGDLIWRKINKPLHLNRPENAQLLVNLDRAYIYTGVEGQIFQIDIDNGETMLVTELPAPYPKKVFLREKTIFWLISLEGTRYWFSQNTVTKDQQSIEGQGVFQSSFSQVRDSLPGGGALLTTPTDHTVDLIWMGSEGNIIHHLALAGIVRVGENLVVATREGNTTTITRWNKGQVIHTIEVDIDPSQKLFYADQDMYYFMSPIPFSGAYSLSFTQVDRNGNVDARTSLDPKELELQERMSKVDLDQAIVESNGSVLLPGADSEGVFIVRIQGMPNDK